MGQRDLPTRTDFHMTELLDIDLDFAVCGTAGAIPRPQQSISPKDHRFIARLLQARAPNAWFMDEHGHALTAWVRQSVRGARCWHIDAHHDMYGSTDTSVWRRRATEANAKACRDSSQWTSATYLLHAWRAGIIRNVVWIIPDWLSREDAESDLRREMGSNAPFIDLVRQEDVILPTADVTTIAWSRRWIDRAFHDLVCSGLPSMLMSAIERGEQSVPVPPYVY